MSTTTNNSKYKPLDKQAVLIAASRLMLANGQTTTKEVKEALQKDGYWAIQDDISAHMSQLKTEEDWQMGDNGTHRIYSGKAIQAVMQSTIAVATHLGNNSGDGKNKNTSTSNTTSSTSNSTTSPAKKDQPLSSPVAGCWEANTIVSGHKPMYFDKSVGRDKVRSLYAKLTGTSRNDARARIYKK